MYPNYHQQSHNSPPMTDSVHNPAAGTSGSQYPLAWNNQMHNNGQYGGQDYAQYAANQYWSGYMNNFNAPAYNPPPSDIPFEQINADNIKVTLHDAKLWNSFHELDNEMVTLPTGLVIFPCLSYIISGLPQLATYIFGLKLRIVNKNTLEYKSGKWKETGKSVKADLESNEIFTESQDGKIVFKNAKIHTIRKKDNAKRKEDDKSTKRKRRAQVDLNEESSNSLLVSSHCRYIPVLSVYYMPSQQSTERKLLKTFEIDETQFVALTSYKNEAVRKMKTNLNPFARPDYKKEIAMNSDESLVNSTMDSGISSMDNTMSSSASSDMSPISSKRTKSDVNFCHPDTSQNQYQFDGSIWNSSMISGPSYFPKSNENSFMNSTSSVNGSSAIIQNTGLHPLQEHSWQPTHPYAPTSPWTSIVPGQPIQPWMDNSSSLDFGQNNNYQF
ncbi:hypothetical protein GCK72_012195 [Caenorhabditis remanei]|uniref:T-box domain-containing protein n=1 Tax=Caenorhabditis remanei TaxID=31234 RepID=A0A6A5GMI9_CAERE|nr:hypothetical protein GCK72_012195 [Caenorhabditis remanei]KAF1755745.1 hypothetical protein GCK72_012195 [Caenorhabditis remanei]